MKTRHSKDRKLKCPFCKASMWLRQTRHGWVYICANWPQCDCVHGCHTTPENFGKPYGKPADAATRQLRTQAHIAFDKLWKDGFLTRKAAYRWLRKALQIKRTIHIGSCSAQRCEQIIQEAASKLRKLENER